MFFKLLPFILCLIHTLSTTSFRIVINTPRGEFVQIVQPSNHNIDVFSLSQGLVRDALRYNLIDNNQALNPLCMHGSIAGGSCKCHPGWGGPKCSIHIHRVSNASIQLMLHPTQFFQVEGDVSEISVNWEANRVYLIDPQTNQQIQQIKYGNRFIKESNKTQLIRVDGNIGDIVSFRKTPNWTQNYMYLVAFSPAVICLSMHMAQRLRSRKRLVDRMQVLSKTTSNDEDCSICLLNEPCTQKVILNCSHSFHRLCLQDWLKQNETCPYCRYNVLDDEQSVNP